MDLVSVVIPSFNSGAYLLDAVASARAQTNTLVETILVNDGTNREECLAYVREASRHVDLYLEQPNRGLPAARNAGFAAARGRYVVPLDADDMLKPSYVADCLAALQAHPSARFVYTDRVVFGSRKYAERLPDYNLYTLLSRNFLNYGALIRKDSWEEVGGYDESMRQGYEDWEFWLRLGARGGFGHHLSSWLFCYRREGASLYDTALSHHDELVAYIHGRHPELYNYNARARLKARWSPAVCVVAPGDIPSQTIHDVQYLAPGELRKLTERSPAPAFLLAAPQAEPHSAELAALAVWSGRDSCQLADGSMARSRRSISQPLTNGTRSLRQETAARSQTTKGMFPFLPTVHRHLVNSRLLEWQSWRHHPLRSVTRLIPLGLKEKINQIAHRPVFDLSFYLQFQPTSMALDNKLVEPLTYFPASPSGRRRIALVTPHLGPGGAEQVLLDLAASLCRERFELLLVATQSNDRRWLPRWRQHIGHIYDLESLVPPERMSAALYSIVKNWNCDAFIVQNSLFGYAALRPIKNGLAAVKTLDLIHAGGPQERLISFTRDLAPAIDIRIAISESVRREMIASGTPEHRIRLIRNGVDLDRFQRFPVRLDPPFKRILFVGRLDPVKRPLLLVRIASELTALRKNRDFRFAIAGDGSEYSRLCESVRRAGLKDIFEFHGHLDDVLPVFAESDILILPSMMEGVPLVILEAFACGRPVVASRVGAVAELVDPSCGVLIDTTADEITTFAGALDSLLDKPRMREQMGLMGRKKVEDCYDLRRCREDYARLLCELTSPPD